MQNIGIVGALGSMSTISAILQAVYYMAIIMVAFKAVQALDIYINKNSK